MNTFKLSLQRYQFRQCFIILGTALLFSFGAFSARATDLEVSYTSVPSVGASIPLNQTVELRIVAKNTSTEGGGPYDSPNTTITIYLEDGVAFHDIQVYANEADEVGQEFTNYSLQSNTLTLNLGTLSAGDVRCFGLFVTTRETGSCKITTNIFGNLFDPVPANNHDETTLTITGNAGSLQFALYGSGKDEGLNTVTFHVDRKGGSEGQVSVNYTTIDQTASAPDDYTAATGTLTWADGDTAIKTFTVTIIDDTLVEDNEKFKVVLSNPTGGATLGVPDSVLHEIFDNEDADDDGIPNAEENGVKNGDGNNNDVQDRLEPNVASFISSESEYCTLSSPDGTFLKEVKAIDNPSPDNTPENVSFPSGFFGFAVHSVTPGGCTQVTLVIPRDDDITTFHKYGPTPDNPEDHWYEFLYDGETGAEISHEGDYTRIVLHLCEGKRGDHDDTDNNGVIVDPGAPAVLINGGGPSSTGDGDGHHSKSGCFIDTVNSEVY